MKRSELSSFAGKTIVALIPIPFSFCGRLFLESRETAIKEIHDWHSANASIDILLTAFGILAGVLWLSNPQGNGAKSVSMGIAMSFVALGLFLTLVLCSLLPSLDIYSKDNIFFNLALPVAISLTILGYAVKVVS